MSKKTIEELMAEVPLGDDRRICARECIDFSRLCSDEDQHPRVEDAEQYGKPGQWRVLYRSGSGNGVETHIFKIGDHDRAERRQVLLRSLRALVAEANELGMGATPDTMISEFIEALSR